MNRKEFVETVTKELITLKAKATSEEIAKLDISTFRYNNRFLCIYGQMTGNCKSERAKTLIPKTLDGDIWNIGDFEDFPEGDDFTALELYLYKTRKVTHKKIIDFLKGETDTIKLK